MKSNTKSKNKMKGGELKEGEVKEGEVKEGEVPSTELMTVPEHHLPLAVSALAKRVYQEPLNTGINAPTAAYIPIAHGSYIGYYKQRVKKIVPKGCIIVVMTPPGDLTISMELYNNIALLLDKKNRDVVLDPAGKSNELYALFKNSPVYKYGRTGHYPTFSMYREGEEYNEMTLSCISIQSKFIQQSGILTISESTENSYSYEKKDFKEGRLLSLFKSDNTTIFKVRNGKYVIRNIFNDIPLFFPETETPYFASRSHVRDILDSIEKYANGITDPAEYKKQISENTLKSILMFIRKNQPDSMLISPVFKFNSILDIFTYLIFSRYLPPEIEKEYGISTKMAKIYERQWIQTNEEEILWPSDQINNLIPENIKIEAFRKMDSNAYGHILMTVLTITMTGFMKLYNNTGIFYNLSCMGNNMAHMHHIKFKSGGEMTNVKTLLNVNAIMNKNVYGYSSVNKTRNKPKNSNEIHKLKLSNIIGNRILNAEMKRKSLIRNYVNPSNTTQRAGRRRK